MSNADSFRAAVKTAVLTFIVLFGAALTGWLTDLLRWAEDAHHVVLFPDPHVLAKAALAAAISAVLGLAAFVVHFAQRALGVGKVATYVKPPPATRPLRRG